MPAPAPHTDALIRRLEAEVDERSALIQGIAQDAQAAGRDLTDSELEQMNRAQTRIDELGGQLQPLRQAAKTTLESRARMDQVTQELESLRRRTPGGGLPSGIEYRSAGEYFADVYTARMGDRESMDRLESFHRAAAHQTTADNPGLLPERIVEPILKALDYGRPLVSAIGPRPLGPGSPSYSRVTQHTLVAEQTAEKAELASRKMLVTKTPIVAPTYGGYVNISRQDIRRADPGIVNEVIEDLVGQYGLVTEAKAGTDLVAAATASTIDIPSTPTLLGISQAIWGAVGQSAAALRTANLPAVGPVLAVSPDRMGLVGPLFPNVNPQNQISTGFQASNLGEPGFQGNLSGMTTVMSTGLAAGTILFFYRSAVRVYEERYGALTVDEPSVWGMQVGYAGDFETVAFGGVIAIEVAA